MQVALQEKNAQTCPMVELYTLFYDPAVCQKDTKWKKAYLISMVIYPCGFIVPW